MSKWNKVFINTNLKNPQSTYKKMDPNQSLILLFVMQKMHQKKLKKRHQESIIQLLTVRYFWRTLIQRAREAFS